ncbi:hypothetical protein AB0I81_60015 [Nonomuraea sp. NPDC050404]|uniref:hypothetical protein n=1 Tax=Nonomuraea sp. NPDC050404 TaxID=3155783 RepID=UPI0033E503CF
MASRTYDGRRVSVQRGWAYVAGGGGATQEVAFGALVSAGKPVGNADGVKMEITTDGGSTHIDCTESLVRGSEKYTWFYIPHPNDSNYLFRACYYVVQTGSNRACTGWW